METQTVEYKQTWRDDFLKEICGFANAQGGTLYIGINDKGDVVGVEQAKQLMEKLPNQCIMTMGIAPDVNLHEEQDRQYISLSVKPSELAIAYKGKYYFRSGTTLQELTGAALSDFLLSKMNLTWDSMPVQDATLDDIDEDAIRYFVQRGIGCGRLTAKASAQTPRQILDHLNLIDKQGRLRMAAILLFGKNPQQFVFGAVFRIGRFKTNTDLLFQDEVKGNIIEMADEVMDYLRGKYLYAPVHYEGMQRVEELEVPETALRELLYNAIVHRDYRGAHTQMKVYDDKIRLWNDGILPEGYNLQSLIEEHSSYARNKLIANAFYIAGFIENWGRGIEKVQEEFAAANLPIPTFETNSGGVLVTIPRGGITNNDTKSITKSITKNVTPKGTDNVTKTPLTGLNTEDNSAFGNVTKIIKKKVSKNVTKDVTIILSGFALRIVEMIEVNPKVTTAQLAETIGIAKKNLIALTNNLQRDGIIRHVGPNRGGHWEVVYTANNK